MSRISVLCSGFFAASCVAFTALGFAALDSEALGDEPFNSSCTGDCPAYSQVKGCSGEPDGCSGQTDCYCGIVRGGVNGPTCDCFIDE